MLSNSNRKVYILILIVLTFILSSNYNSVPLWDEYFIVLNAKNNISLFDYLLLPLNSSTLLPSGEYRPNPYQVIPNFIVYYFVKIGYYNIIYPRIVSLFCILILVFYFYFYFKTIEFKDTFINIFILMNLFTNSTIHWFFIPVRGYVFGLTFTILYLLNSLDISKIINSKVNF
jgi:hypothetical protein